MDVIERGLTAKLNWSWADYGGRKPLEELPKRATQGESAEEMIG